MPSDAKFFKELNTNQRRYKLNKRVVVSKNYSAILQYQLSRKFKDPDSFIINITIRDRKVAKSMLDLDNSINLMSYYIFL